MMESENTTERGTLTWSLSGRTGWTRDAEDHNFGFYCVPPRLDIILQARKQITRRGLVLFVGVQGLSVDPAAVYGVPFISETLPDHVPVRVEWDAKEVRIFANEVFRGPCERK